MALVIDFWRSKEQSREREWHLVPSLWAENGSRGHGGKGRVSGWSRVKAQDPARTEVGDQEC